MSNISTSEPVYQDPSDVNILLLGETGVGKTTFINSFVNYLIYDKLEDSLEGEMAVVIPAVFDIADPETYEPKSIYIGKQDQNEKNEKIGESKTQKCKTYVFLLGHRRLRLIDAPGVCDTRGIEQDEKNFEHIVAYISQYKHLDGICILLQPNKQRLDVSFRFCVKELLTHLNASARNNIMFVFTFGRTNFYSPGQTAVLLKKLLNELFGKTKVEVPFSDKNTFTLDNESFRFLAEYKNGIEFPQEQMDEFKKSWDRSVRQYGNLVECIISRAPHMVRDTLSLNEAKQLIKKLNRPTAEVIRLIQENIAIAEKYRKDSETDRILNVTTNNLSSDYISLPQYSGKIIRLDYPRTVCTSKSCTRIILIEGEETMDYVSHCHEHCYLQGVEQEVINNPALKACSAMDQMLEICDKCKCSWSAHKHITYEYRKQVAVVNLPLTTSTTADASHSTLSINSSSTSTGKPDVITPEMAVKNHIINLRKEFLTMIQVCRKLSRFLRVNSITPYNDDSLEYIKHFIHEEETKREAGAKNEEVILGLQATLDAYEEDMAFFELAADIDHDPTAIFESNDEAISLPPGFSDNTETPTIDDIFPLVESLYALPLNGDKIRQQVENLKTNQMQNLSHNEQLVPLPSITTSSIIGRLNQMLKTNMIPS